MNLYLFFIFPLALKIKTLNLCTYNMDCKLPNICCGKAPFKYCCTPKNMKLIYISNNQYLERS